METVSVTRDFDAGTHHVRSILENVTAFFEAAGFEVTRADDRLELTKQVALMQVELDLRLRDDESGVLAYEQIAGPFETMRTLYQVNPASTGSTLTIETSFEPPSTGFGTFLDDAVIKQQRRAELDAVTSLLQSHDGSPDRANENPTIEGG
jgi:hypothetical protein